MDWLASLYIDNELDLDAKGRFIDRIHTDPPFYRDTRALIIQEKLLRTPPPDHSRLPVQPPVPANAGFRFKHFMKPLAYAAACLAVAAVVLVHLPSAPKPKTQRVNQRFVVYQPDARRVELTASFIHWQRLPMKPAGTSGYWQLNLPVPYGEHRIAYIVDDKRPMPDPTLSAREPDDFGGENAILKVTPQV